MPTEGLIQQRHPADNLAVKCVLVNHHTALCQHLLENAQAQVISQISANILGNYINGIMQASEGLSVRFSPGKI